MRSRRSLCLLTLCLITSLFLTSCIRTLAPTRPLAVTTDGDATETAVAIQADGTKHYVWTECTGSGTSTTCRLVYYRTKLGTPLYHYLFAVAPGMQVKYPDLAVAADGQAFVVRSVCGTTGCTDYYSIIPATVDASIPIASYELAGPGISSAGPPKIEARDNVVYATYVTSGDAQPRLRYRQLRGGSSGGFVESRSDVLASNPSMAIDNNGKLHVTWLADTTSSREIAYGNNMHSAADFGPSISYDSGGNYNFKHPDIALDSSNTPYIVYAYDGGTGDILKLQCAAAASSCFNGVATRTIPLDTSQEPWRIRGNPHIAVTGALPNVVFSAKNSATSNYEIWRYIPPTPDLDQGLDRVTTNDVEDDEPLIAEENSNFGDIVVVGWRTYHPIPVPPPGSYYDCSDAVYVFYHDNSTLRQVYSRTGGCFNQGRDLAANGEWVAGVWLDFVSAGSASRRVPWTTFNAYTNWLPIVAK